MLFSLSFRNATKKENMKVYTLVINKHLIINA